jgi:glycosyltransferase involved in cell wall biosynthesis
MTKTRIAVVNSHPIQYFAPLYAYLNRSPVLEVTALYCSDYSLRGATDPGFKQQVTWDVDLLCGYQAVFLGERARTRIPRGFWSLVVPEVWREVRSGKYDAVILHGHNYAANFLALLAAKTKGIPLMMRCETHLGLQRKGVKRMVRRLVMGVFYSTFDRFLAIGTLNRAFYLAMGVPPEKIVLVPYSVDNERFARASALSDVERREVRRSLGLPESAPVVLYASKLMRRKHPDDLLRAAANLRERGLEFSVLIVGTGEMEQELKQLSRTLKLTNVVFAGFANQSELPRLFAAADVFVLPSENEPWGLIVNEVMAAGLPVVVSRELGCVPDLVIGGETGFVHATGDLDAIANALERLLGNSALRDRMAGACRERMKTWSYAQCLQGLQQAVNSVSRRATLSRGAQS